jgi:prevent-host-death family protein
VGTAYSTYEAKAKFSEVMRKVRGGQRVVVTYHGEPVAEITPVGPTADGVRGRAARLASTGELIPGSGDFKTFQPVARRPGALRRFLDDRG